MFLATATAGSTIAQFFTVLLIFIFVIAITLYTTKWVGGYAKEKNISGNITVIETKRIAPNKYVEIVRIGEQYFAIALGKNEVTFLGEVPYESLVFPEETGTGMTFKDFLNKAKEVKKDN